MCLPGIEHGTHWLVCRDTTTEPSSWRWELMFKYNIYVTNRNQSIILAVSKRFLVHFSDTPYIVWGVSIYQDMCFLSVCPVTWIDLDKWISVKTFHVSLLGSHSLVLAGRKHNQWICFIIHSIVIITLENHIWIKGGLWLQMAFF